MLEVSSCRWSVWGVEYIFLRGINARFMLSCRVFLLFVGGMLLGVWDDTIPTSSWCM